MFILILPAVFNHPVCTESLPGFLTVLCISPWGICQLCCSHLFNGLIVFCFLDSSPMHYLGIGQEYILSSD